MSRVEELFSFAGSTLLFPFHAYPDRDELASQAEQLLKTDLNHLALPQALVLEIFGFADRGLVEDGSCFDSIALLWKYNSRLKQQNKEGFQNESFDELRVVALICLRIAVKVPLFPDLRLSFLHVICELTYPLQAREGREVETIPAIQVASMTSTEAEVLQLLDYDLKAFSPFVLLSAYLLLLAEMRSFPINPQELRNCSKILRVYYLNRDAQTRDWKALVIASICVGLCDGVPTQGMVNWAVGMGVQGKRFTDMVYCLNRCVKI